MPDPISKDATVATFLRIGYEILAEEGGFIMFSDPAYPVRPLTIDFSRGEIAWVDFQRQLEYEGIDVARFLAELESF